MALQLDSSAFDSSKFDSPKGPKPQSDDPHDSAPHLPLSIDGSPESAARRVQAVSVEGRPADAKSGPGRLILEMGAMMLVVLIFAGVGWIFDWRLGAAILAIGLLATLFNPVMWATANRVAERKVVTDEDEARK